MRKQGVFIVVCLFLLSGSLQAAQEASARPEESLVQDVKKRKTCDSFKEFQAAYEFLLKDEDLSLGEEKAARLALQVSQGCNGSANRFLKAYRMMSKTGVALTKAVEVGLDFAALNDERLKNFEVVFAQMYLQNKYDFDFATAYKVSFHLSRDYEGKAQDVRSDFASLVKFCTDAKEATLPLRQCAELSLNIVEYTPLFPGGLYKDFEKFYKFLRSSKYTGLSVIEALNMIPRVFIYGPKAPDNFQKGIEYALGNGKINVDHPNAINLALRLASQSLPVGETKDGDVLLP